jgi:hypothetical protein
MNAINRSSKFQRSPDLVWTDMDGEIVTLSIDRGEYAGLGGVGTRVWELLEEPLSLQEVSARLVLEFDVDPETCTEDVAQFIGQLVEAGLVHQS